MKNVVKYLAFMFLALNVFYFAWWIYVYDAHPAYDVRLQAFNQLNPFSSVALLSGLLILLTIISIIVFIRGKLLFNRLLIITQSVFLLFYVWGLL